MRFTLTCDKPFFGGTIPAGTVVFISTGMIYHNGIGFGPVFLDDCLTYLDSVPLNTATYKSADGKNPPWIGPDATVKVPEFAPAAKPVEAKPPIEVVKVNRHAVKPAAGQGGFSFDDEPVSVAPVAAVPAVVVAEPVAQKSWLADLDL